MLLISHNIKTHHSFASLSDLDLFKISTDYKSIQANDIVKLHIIQQNKFQTKHDNLEAVNAYPKLDTSTRPGKITQG